MSNEASLPKVPEERLAAEMPDACGPPKSARPRDAVRDAIGSMGVVAVVVGGLMLPMAASTGHSGGATRSS